MAPTRWNYGAVWRGVQRWDQESLPGVDFGVDIQELRPIELILTKKTVFFDNTDVATGKNEENTESEPDRPIGTKLRCKQSYGSHVRDPRNEGPDEYEFGVLAYSHRVFRCPNEEG